MVTCLTIYQASNFSLKQNYGFGNHHLIPSMNECDVVLKSCALPKSKCNNCDHYDPKMIHYDPKALVFVFFI